jgi:hypothetical protein
MIDGIWNVKSQNDMIQTSCIFGRKIQKSINPKNPNSDRVTQTIFSRLFKLKFHIESPTKIT